MCGLLPTEGQRTRGLQEPGAIPRNGGIEGGGGKRERGIEALPGGGRGVDGVRKLFKKSGPVV